MTQEERTKKYKSYTSKINLLCIESPFVVNEAGDIEVDIFKFVDLQGYPKILIIPDFVVKTCIQERWN